MKKFLILLTIALIVLGYSVAHAVTVFQIQQGGTNNGSAPSTNSLIYFDGTKYTSTSTQPLYVGNINATSTTATSTFANGINLTGGCFAVAGTCVTGSGSSVTMSGAYDYITLSGQDIVRGQIDLATDVTGTLAITNGGTGTSTPAVLGDVLSWNGTNWEGVATSTLGISGGGGSSQWTTSGSDIYYTTGNVGIGTSSPYAKLSVAGLGVFNNIFASSTTATSTFAGNLVASGSRTEIDNLYSGAMSFPSDAGVVSWMDVPVTSSLADNTVVSYTGQIDGNPVLTVYGQSDGSGGVDNLRVGIASTTPWRTFSVNGTVAFNGLSSSTSGNALCILSGGEVVNAGGTTCTTSSLRFKENVIPLEDALAILMRLNAVEYDRKDNGKHEIGLIAEEVNKVYPFLVEYEKDGVTPRGVDYLHLTALIVQGMQEQQRQIDSLDGNVGTSRTDMILLGGLIALAVLVIKKK